MKICSFELHSIAIADPPLRSSYGLHAPWALRTIVEIKTDDGITGVGETYGGTGPLTALENARQHVIGRDPFQLAALYREICGRADLWARDLLRSGSGAGCAGRTKPDVAGSGRESARSK